MPNNILVVFRNDSNYDHSFFNKLAIAFEGRFECQNLFCFNRKITENVDKDGKKNIVTIPCNIKFLDTARFMVSSLSNLVYILQV